MRKYACMHVSPACRQFICSFGLKHSFFCVQGGSIPLLHPVRITHAAPRCNASESATQSAPAGQTHHNDEAEWMPRSRPQMANCVTELIGDCCYTLTLLQHFMHAPQPSKHTCMHAEVVWDRWMNLVDPIGPPSCQNFDP